MMTRYTGFVQQLDKLNTRPNLVVVRPRSLNLTIKTPGSLAVAGGFKTYILFSAHHIFLAHITPDICVYIGVGRDSVRTAVTV
jgi:hypothetical protein